MLSGPHDGYEDGETPVYQPCPVCGETVRADRLDLLEEHRLTRCQPPIEDDR